MRQWLANLGLIAARGATVQTLGVGVCLTGILSLPAALAGSGVGLWIAVGAVLSGAAAWVLGASPQYKAWSGRALVGGLSVILAVAALASTSLPTVWGVLVGAPGLLSLIVARLWGWRAALIWGAGEVMLFALAVYLGRGWLDWQTAALALAFLLAANGLAWLLEAGERTGLPAEARGTVIMPTSPDGAKEALAARFDEIASELEQAAVVVQGVTDEQFTSADLQSGILADMTSAFKGYQQTVDQVRTLTESMVRLLRDATVHSDEGQQAAAGAILSLESIRAQVKGIALNLATLARHTERIGEIIASLGDLATQSNYLALNASIEAARAGEHGRGFAVVAAEVRDLAQQSAEASAQVRNILVEIRQAVQQSAVATESGADGVDTGVAKVTESAHMVGRIVAYTSQSATMAQQVAAALEKQSGVLGNLVTTLRQIDETQMQHSTNARMAEAVAGNLRRLSAQMRAAASKENGGEAVE